MTLQMCVTNSEAYNNIATQYSYNDELHNLPREAKKKALNWLSSLTIQYDEEDPSACLPIHLGVKCMKLGLAKAGNASLDSLPHRQKQQQPQHSTAPVGFH